MSASSKLPPTLIAPGPEKRPPFVRGGGFVQGFSLGLNLSSCLILTAVLGWLALYVPTLERQYSHLFNARLADSTIWVFSASHVVRSLGALALPLALLPMVTLICLSVLWRHIAMPLISAAVLVVLAVLGALSVLAVWSPMACVDFAYPGP